jgi:hypothetical protein
MITTHSCITLTDAFDNEITLFHKELENGRVSAMASPVRSFGASTSEIIREIFGAPDNVGKRASEFLDLALHAAAHADAVEKIWELNGDEAAIRQSVEFQTLMSSPDASAPPREGFDRQLLTVIASLRDYAKAATDEPKLKFTNALGALENRLGSGYYQFEFRRRLRALRTPQHAS